MAGWTATRRPYYLVQLEGDTLEGYLALTKKFGTPHPPVQKIQEGSDLWVERLALSGIVLFRAWIDLDRERAMAFEAEIPEWKFVDGMGDSPIVLKFQFIEDKIPF